MRLWLGQELNSQPRKSNLKTPGGADGEALTSLFNTFSETPVTPGHSALKAFHQDLSHCPQQGRGRDVTPPLCRLDSSENIQKCPGGGNLSQQTFFFLTPKDIFCTVTQDTVIHVEERKCLQQCILLFKTFLWTSLVVQWLGIHLAMQRKWVRSLVQEDSTCCRATKPTRHNY